MKKYVWRKKREFISEAESVNDYYLYEHIDAEVGKWFMMNLFNVVDVVEIENGDKKAFFSIDKLNRYLYTEEEIVDILPNTYTMFEKLDYCITKCGIVKLKEVL